MNAKQEPKYAISDGKLVNRQSLQPIPEDEPLFILRGRDKLAADAIGFYLIAVEGAIEKAGRIGSASHIRAVELRLNQFRDFAKAHPDRMHLPDTTLTKDWQP